MVRPPLFESDPKLADLYSKVQTVILARSFFHLLEASQTGNASNPVRFGAPHSGLLSLVQGQNEVPLDAPIPTPDTSRLALDGVKADSLPPLKRAPLTSGYVDPPQELLGLERGRSSSAGSSASSRKRGYDGGSDNRRPSKMARKDG
jgi:hypothetical protein